MKRAGTVSLSAGAISDEAIVDAGTMFSQPFGLKALWASLCKVAQFIVTGAMLNPELKHSVIPHEFK